MVAIKARRRSLRSMESVTLLSVCSVWNASLLSDSADGEVLPVYIPSAQDLGVSVESYVSLLSQILFSIAAKSFKHIPLHVCLCPMLF